MLVVLTFIEKNDNSRILQNLKFFCETPNKRSFEIKITEKQLTRLSLRHTGM